MLIEVIDDYYPRSMTSNDQSWLHHLTQAFQLGEPRHVIKLQVGQIQQTWRLATATSTYICQKLHPAFAREVTEDAQVVSTYLCRQGFCVPQYLTTDQSELHLEHEGLWRVMTCLPGLSHRTAPDLGYLDQAGYAAGQLHQLLSRFDYRFRFQLPHFHNTAYIWHALQVQADTPPVQKETAFFLENIPALLLPADLPSQVIHGDLKLTNFLFDSEGAVAGLVDLDTFMYHSLYVELGDALRSWCSLAETFSLPALQASLSGYARSGGLEKLETEYLVKAIKLITLELGMRYLQDYFDDHYFQWDSSLYPDRRTHNLARCRRQIAIYEDICLKERELTGLVGELYTVRSRAEIRL